MKQKSLFFLGFTIITLLILILGAIIGIFFSISSENHFESFDEDFIILQDADLEELGYYDEPYFEERMAIQSDNSPEIGYAKSSMEMVEEFQIPIKQTFYNLNYEQTKNYLQKDFKSINELTEYFKSKDYQIEQEYNSIYISKEDDCQKNLELNQVLCKETHITLFPKEEKVFIEETYFSEEIGEWTKKKFFQ